MNVIMMIRKNDDDCCNSFVILFKLIFFTHFVVINQVGIIYHIPTISLKKDYHRTLLCLTFF